MFCILFVFETNLHKSVHLTQFVVTFSELTVTNVKIKSNIMEKESMAAIMGVGLFTCITLCVYFIMRYRSTAINIPGEDRKKQSSDWQKPGILVLGIGTGLLIVGVIQNYVNADLPDSLAVAILIIAAGVSMIIANKLDKKHDI
jgi:undecaprenyl pyrophosphate phosphatase UppP